ncbi:MAG: fimbrillin family protein [Candidatus Cryptobacteroides sp.]
MMTKGMKVFQILFFPILSLLSCSEAQERGREDEVPFAFEIAVNPNTKSDATIQLPGDCVVWVYDNEEAVLDGEMLVKNGSLWYPEGGQNWPVDCGELSFYAACPRERAAFSLDEGVQFLDYSLDEDSQPLYAGPFCTDNAHSSAGVVPLVFSRALALVRFNFSAMLREGSSLAVKKIAIDGVYDRGDFRTLPSVVWQPQGERKTIEIYNGSFEADNALERLCEVWMIPQTVRAEVKVICDIESGGNVLHDQELTCTTDFSWKTSKLSVYNLKVNLALELGVEKDME